MTTAAQSNQAAWRSNRALRELVKDLRGRADELERFANAASSSLRHEEKGVFRGSALPETTAMAVVRALSPHAGVDAATRAIENAQRAARE